MTGAVLLLVLVVQASTPAAAVRLDVQDAAALPFTPSLLEAAVEARQPVARGADAASARRGRGPFAGGRVGGHREPVAPPAAGGARAGPRPRRPAWWRWRCWTCCDRSSAGATRGRDHVRPDRRQDRASRRRRRRSIAAAAWIAVAAPGASFGFDSGAASFEPTAALTWWSGHQLAGGATGLTAEVAFNRATAQRQPAPLHPGHACRRGWARAGAGAGSTPAAGSVLRSYRTAGLDGGRAPAPERFLSVRAGLPLGWGLRGLAALTCDFVTQRLDFRAAGLTRCAAPDTPSPGWAWGWPGKGAGDPPGPARRRHRQRPGAGRARQGRRSRRLRRAVSPPRRSGLVAPGAPAGPGSRARGSAAADLLRGVPGPVAVPGRGRVPHVPVPGGGQQSPAIT